MIEKLVTIKRSEWNSWAISTNLGELYVEQIEKRSANVAAC